MFSAHENFVKFKAIDIINLYSNLSRGVTKKISVKSKVKIDYTFEFIFCYNFINSPYGETLFLS